MYWYHEVALEWMKARQSFLTATDIKDLLPVTKTGRKRTVDQSDYLKVFARKMKQLTERDCVSTGAAARGHILEPYAIDALNSTPLCGANYMYHWDDKLIVNDNLAFSPDGLNTNRDGQVVYDYKDLQDATSLVEIKCYNSESHYVKGSTDKMKLEERWQIATAFCVCPQISEGYLVLYDPSTRYQLFVHEYNREDLKDEMDIIKDIAEKYKQFRFEPTSGYLESSVNNEEVIIAEQNLEVSESFIELFDGYNPIKELDSLTIRL